MPDVLKFLHMQQKDKRDTRKLFSSNTASNRQELSIPRGYRRNSVEDLTNNTANKVARKIKILKGEPNIHNSRQRINSQKMENKIKNIIQNIGRNNIRKTFETEKTRTGLKQLRNREKSNSKKKHVSIIKSKTRRVKRPKSNKRRWKKETSRQKVRSKFFYVMPENEHNRREYDNDEDERSQTYYFPYELRIPSDLRMARDRTFYGKPFYDNYDNYYEEERKDVIPKPSRLVATENAKRVGYTTEKGDKRSPYAPVVSAVQNLDRSETELFHSLFSPEHDTKDVSLDLNNELSNFAKVPSNLEVYTPSDTPGEMYFDKDQNADDTSTVMQNLYQAAETTQRPTDDTYATSEIVDNEERLLSMVKKVIEKQKNQKGEGKNTRPKLENAVRMGDTSEVFNTGTSGTKMATGTYHSLSGLVSKQTTSKEKTPSGKFQGNIDYPVDKLATKRKAHNSVNNLHHKKDASNYKQPSSIANSKPAATFKINSVGQRIIVENAKNDDSIENLIEALESPRRKNASVSSRASQKHSPVLIENEVKDASKEIGRRLPLSKNVPGLRKDKLIKEPTVGDYETRLTNGKSAREYESKTSSRKEDNALRHSVNDNSSPFVANENAFNWYDKQVAFKSLSGDKKDDDQAEKEAVAKGADNTANTAVSTTAAPAADTQKQNATQTPSLTTQNPAEAENQQSIHPTSKLFSEPMLLTLTHSKIHKNNNMSICFRVGN